MLSPVLRTLSSLIRTNLVPSLNSNLSSNVIPGLQISLSPIIFLQILGVYLGKNHLELGNAKPEVIRNAQPTESQG